MLRYVTSCRSAVFSGMLLLELLELSLDVQMSTPRFREMAVNAGRICASGFSWAGTLAQAEIDTIDSRGYYSIIMSRHHNHFLRQRL